VNSIDSFEAMALQHHDFKTITAERPKPIIIVGNHIDVTGTREVRMLQLLSSVN
jgi:hypothetical protein